MAGDLDLSPLQRPVRSEYPRESQPVEVPEEVAAKEQKQDSPDVSARRRAALEAAMAAVDQGPKGRLVIEQDSETGKFVQKIVDPASGKVIRQWPEEQFLELAKQMGEAYGVFVDRSV